MKKRFYLSWLLRYMLICVVLKRAAKSGISLSNGIAKTTCGCYIV